MEKHLLHLKNPELQTSPEVGRAVERQEHQSGEKLPNDPSERIEAYMGRLERLILDPEKEQKKKDVGDVLHTERPRALSLLRQKIINEYIIPNKGKMAEGAAIVEERAARQMGIQAEYDEEQMEQRAEIAVGDLESSLDQWITYLSDPNEPYPAWFRYYAFRNILNLGEYDKDKQEFPKRSKGTFKLFPDVDRGALAYVEEMMEAAQDPNVLNRIRESQKELWDIPEQDLLTKEKAKAFANLSFAKQYAEGIKQNGEISPELRAETRGEWVHYTQGDDPKDLWLSLQNKGTAWCTKGYPTAKTQLAGGDFYVYYTLDTTGNPTIPRIAIRMEGDEKIAENPRGVFDSQQNLEPNMVEIMEEKLKEFGSEANKFKKKSDDMRILTVLEKKHEKGEQLTKDDLVFLYEIDGSIEGFGYQKDPRIAEIRTTRNLAEDLSIIFECKPEDIATDLSEIKETTKLYAGKINSYDLCDLSYDTLRDILNRTTIRLFDTNDMKEIKLKRENLSSLDYEVLKKTNTSKVGEVYFNPESLSIDWKTINPEKIKSFDFAEFVGKSRAELATHIAKKCGDKYIIPDFTYRQFLLDNPDNIPSLMKDGNYYYFYGSVLRRSNGSATVPHVYWLGSKLHRDDAWLDDDWSGSGRVVLLER